MEQVSVVASQMINENEFTMKNTIVKLLKQWDSRMTVVQSNSECVEQILSNRRTLLTLLEEKAPSSIKKMLNIELGKYWIKSADIARK